MEGLEYSVGFLKRYIMREKIGRGHSAEVFTCSNEVTGVVYAVKVFTVNTWKRSTTILEAMRCESQMMQEVKQNSHSSILHLVEIFVEYTDNKIYTVMELATEGELFDLLARRRKLTEEARKIFSQVLSGLEFLVSL